MNSKNSRLINSLRKLLLGNNIQIEMEQTKAVFRNKPFILLKGIILLLIFILTTSLVRAQYSLGFAREVGNRVLFMADGKLLVDGTPTEIFDNPTNPRLQEFLSKVL